MKSRWRYSIGIFVWGITVSMGWAGGSVTVGFDQSPLCAQSGAKGTGWACHNHGDGVYDVTSYSWSLSGATLTGSGGGECVTFEYPIDSAGSINVSASVSVGWANGNLSGTESPSGSGSAEVVAPDEPCEECENGVVTDTADGGSCVDGGRCCNKKCISDPDESCTPSSPANMGSDNLGVLKVYFNVLESPPWPFEPTVREVVNGSVEGRREKEYVFLSGADENCGEALIRSDYVSPFSITLAIAPSWGIASLELFSYEFKFKGVNVQYYNEPGVPCIKHFGEKWKINARTILTASGSVKEYVRDLEVTSDWTLSFTTPITGNETSDEWQPVNLVGTTCSVECAPN